MEEVRYLEAAKKVGGTFLPFFCIFTCAARLAPSAVSHRPIAVTTAGKHTVRSTAVTYAVRVGLLRNYLYPTSTHSAFSVGGRAGGRIYHWRACSRATRALVSFLGRPPPAPLKALKRFLVEVQEGHL